MQDGCTKLVRSLLEEYRRRSPYIAYLVRSRQGLLSSLATLEKVALRLENEQRMSSKFLITVCVRCATSTCDGTSSIFHAFRLFLERREDELVQLKVQFSSTNVMDEKTELVVQFLNRWWNVLDVSRSVQELATISYIPGCGKLSNRSPCWRQPAKTREKRRERRLRGQFFPRYFALLQMMSVSSCSSMADCLFPDLYGSTVPQH